MYVQSTPNTLGAPRKDGELVEKGAYFIIDMTSNDPLHRGKSHPIVVAGNMTPDELKLVDAGKIRIEPPRFGTNQRLLLQVVEIHDITDKK
jgi:hypothetical protein